MAYGIDYNGVRDNAPFHLNSTTKSAIESDPKQIMGKVVTLTGNGEVGYGADGDDPIGVVQFPPEWNTTNDHDFLVTVSWGMCFEGIKCAGTESAGDYLACDGNGGVKTSVDATHCVALSVDTSTNTCAIKMV